MRFGGGASIVEFNPLTILSTALTGWAVLALISWVVARTRGAVLVRRFRRQLRRLDAESTALAQEH